MPEQTHTPAPLDWNAFINEYRQVIGNGSPAPIDFFPALNMMADELLSTHGPLPDGSWVEVSTGTFLDDRVIGVTVAGPNPSRPWTERSRGVETFTSVGAVREHLEALGIQRLP